LGSSVLYIIGLGLDLGIGTLGDGPVSGALEKLIKEYILCIVSLESEFRRSKSAIIRSSTVIGPSDVLTWGAGGIGIGGEMS